MKSSQSTQTQIFSIQNIKQLLTSRRIGIRTIICWDLDNTIFQSTKELGSDQWFGHFFQMANSKLASAFKLEQMIQTYNAVQKYVDATYVEPETIKIIKALHAIKIKQVFLTARNNDLIEITHRQLQQVGINPSLFPIIFCNGRDKGKVLFENLRFVPRHLMMIDDKVENVEHIQNACLQRDIPFTGFHYNFLLKKVKSFDIGYAHFQLSLIQASLPQYINDLIKRLELSWEEKHEQECDDDCQSTTAVCFGK
jgi:hypothetical protein